MINVGEPNYLKIETIHAFISVDEKGDEGVCGFMSGQGWMPMVCADEARVNSLRQLAKKMSKETKMQIKLIRFSVREDLEIIKG